MLNPCGSVSFFDSGSVKLKSTHNDLLSPKFCATQCSHQNLYREILVVFNNHSNDPTARLDKQLC